MKILIVGNNIFYGLPTSFKRAFEGMGYRVSIFDEDYLYEHQLSFLKNKYTSRLFWKQFSLPIQRKLIEKIEEEKPDLILVVKGWLLKPNTLKEVKKKHSNTPLFCFNPDHPFDTLHRGVSNEWIRKSIPFYDVYFIWGKFLIEVLKQAGAKRVEYLPFAWDPDLHYPVEVSEVEKEHFGSDVVFVGTWTKEREELLSNLLDYNLKIWGDSWQKANRKLQERWMRRPACGEEFCKIVRSSKITLNSVRKHELPAHNMRTFEIPGCGGFMLSIRTEESKDFFQEGKEAEYFSDINELRKKIDFYLRDDELRKEIAENAYRKVSRSEDYTYKARAKRILEVYEEVIGG